jgi:hypothetical protein
MPWQSPVEVIQNPTFFGLFAPGALPFWGMPYDSVGDAGGALDPKAYFKSTGA